LAKSWLLLILLVGCNVANEPAALSSGSGVGGGSGESISFTTIYLNRSESSPLITLPFTLSSPAAESTTVTFSFSGTATGGTSCTGVEDYITPDSVVVAPGDSSEVLDIVLCGDAVFEGNEYLNVTLASNSDSYGLGAMPSMYITLVDNAGPPLVAFASAATASITEGASGVTSVLVDVELSHASIYPITVDLSSTGLATSLDDVISGISTGQVDYFLSTNQLSFPAGVTSSSVLVTVIGDSFIEENEGITLSLSNPINSSIGSQSTHELVIQQDEASSALLASLTIVPAAVDEDDGSMDIVVTLTGDLDVPAVLYYVLDYAAVIPFRLATHDEDFTLSGFNGALGSVTITPNIPYPTTINIPVTLLDDTFYEGTEQFVVKLLGGPLIDVVPGFESIIVTINASDTQPLISFLSSGQTLAETNTAGSVVIRLLDPVTPTIEKASGEDVTVTLTSNNVTTTAADYNLGAFTATIPAGHTRVTVPVTAVQDGVAEGSEFLDIVLTGPAGYTISPNDTHEVEFTDN
jgi:hypothetical protein